MRRRLGISILIIALLSIAVIGCNTQNTEQKSYPIHSTRQDVQTNSPILKMDSVGSTHALVNQLKNNPSIKTIHHTANIKSHYYKNEAVVYFHDNPDDTSLNKMLRDIDGFVKEKLDSTFIFKSNSKSTEALLHYFKQMKNVSFTEPHYIYLKNEVNDTYYLNYQWNLPAIATEDGWTINRGSKKIKIAIVDTGVDLQHPDLANRIEPGFNAINNTNNPDDDNGHGTHVAGIIAADTNNHIGVAGITWYNPIIPVKALGSDGAGGSLNVAKGIIWAVDHGAKVINLSLGNYQPSAVLEKAIRYAQNKDVVLVSAAGNDNSSRPSYPAAYPGVIGVSAIDYNGNRASFSNYGNYVDVAAPGVEIASTYLHGQYAALSGTSMAAPHVTALAALIKSVDPSLKNTEVIDIITKTTQKAGQTGPNPYFGNGIIDNVSALQYASQHKNKFEGAVFPNLGE